MAAGAFCLHERCPVTVQDAKFLKRFYRVTQNRFRACKTNLRFIINDDSIQRIEKTFYTQTFDSIAESLSSDGPGRFVK